MTDGKFAVSEIKDEIKNIPNKKEAIRKLTNILKRMEESDRELPTEFKVRWLLLHGLAIFAGAGLIVSGIKEESSYDVKFGLVIGALGISGFKYTLKILKNSKNSDKK